MRPITMLSAQYKAETKNGTDLLFEKCKGGFFSVNDSFALSVTGDTSQEYTPSVENPAEIHFVKKGTRIVSSGANIFGGEALADAIANATGTSKNTINKTITFAASSMAKNPVLFAGFKANTQYTFIFSYSTNNGASQISNLEIVYTDGTKRIINSNIITSDSNKSVESIRGQYYTSSTVINYENCGIFEGIVSVNEFKPYISGDEITVPCDLYIDDIWFPSSGKVIKGSAVSVLTSASLQGTATVLGETIRCNCQIFNNPTIASSGYTYCSHLNFLGDYSKDEPHFYLYNTGTLGPIFLPVSLVGTTKESMGTWLDLQVENGTPVKIANKLQSPVTEYYPPQNLFLPKGTAKAFQVCDDLHAKLSATALVSRH
ncbi:MAG: hypothetical protein IJO62_04275 [Clostridia bacterium]|nr:hypothetical protein [Clostridia bacterium]